MEPAISSLMAATDRGDGRAAEALFEAIHSELQRTKRELAREAGPGVTVGVTSLLHEAYRVVSAESGASLPDRARFMRHAARVVRGLVIEHARQRKVRERSGQFEITLLEVEIAAGAVDPEELTQIGDALDELAKIEPALAEIVDLKVFCGFSLAEIAVMRRVSEPMAKRSWEKARLYLHRSIRTTPA